MAELMDSDEEIEEQEHFKDDDNSLNVAILVVTTRAAGEGI